MSTRRKRAHLKAFSSLGISCWVYRDGPRQLGHIHEENQAIDHNLFDFALDGDYGNLIASFDAVAAPGYNGFSFTNNHVRGAKTATPRTEELFDFRPARDNVTTDRKTIVIRDSASYANTAANRPRGPLEKLAFKLGAEEEWTVDGWTLSRTQDAVGGMGGAAGMQMTTGGSGGQSNTAGTTETSGSGASAGQGERGDGGSAAMAGQSAGTGGSAGGNDHAPGDAEASQDGDGCSVGGSGRCRGWHLLAFLWIGWLWMRKRWRFR